ncbi:MAG: (2Fe-2S)-binding domain protein [Rhizobacter sp.]|nr:(2Fe-2S)-binding domain protein [Rhizobacter sp.]
MNDVTLRVNGESRTVRAKVSATLLHVLREDLQLTGSKTGCNYGVCGACTVLLDGQPARACLALAHACEGRAVQTIESVAVDGVLHPLQQALLDAGAVQCGFCTPGIVISAKALLDRVAAPSREEVREALSGNLCRCSGYSAIVDAVVSVGRRASDEGSRA